MKSKLQEKRNLIKRKIGFIFFNDYIFLTGDCTKPDFSIGVSSYEQLQESLIKFYTNTSKINENRIKNINYSSYENLFALGEDESKNYNTSLS